MAQPPARPSTATGSAQDTASTPSTTALTSAPPTAPPATSATAPATTWQVQPVAEPDEALRRAIMAPLLAFNTAAAGPSGHQVLALAVRDAQGQVAGGLWASTAHGWLYTQLLAVPEAARGQGLGRQLVLAAEVLARQRGCANAWVDTQFGARGFYQRLGYQVFGELADYPPGFTRSFLKKSLT